MLRRSLVRLAAFVGVLSPLAAQQSWAPITVAGPRATPGVGVTESLLPPMVVDPFPFGASVVHMFVDGAFRRRTEPLPLELAGVQAATFDRQRQRVVAVCLHNGAMVAVVFDGARWSVLPTANAPPPRVQPAVAFDAGSGKVVVFGGAVPGSFGLPLGDTWQLDGGVWSPVVGPGPAPRRSAALAPAVIPGGFGLLLFGGNGQFGGGALHFDDTWAFAGSGWTQLAPTVHPSAREAMALAFDPGSATTLAYGGRAFVGLQLAALGDTWQWSGTDWSAVPPPAGTALGAPQLLHRGAGLALIGRDEAENAIEVHAWQNGWIPVHRGAPDVFQQSLAFDSTRAEVVRFGGRAASGLPYRGDTWIWDGRWSPATPAAAPSPRALAAVAEHPPSGRVVLFGGHDLATTFGDTWLWDGSDWQQVSVAGGPGPRTGAAAAFDPTRGSVVLFGGSSSTTQLDDTWIWDGAAWAPVTSTVVPPAGAGSLAFDQVRQVMVLHAASGSSAVPGTLWELRPTGWLQVNATAPPAGDLVFDPRTGGLALFATIGTSSDYQAATDVWVPRNQNRIGRVVGDPTRGAVLTVGQEVLASVSVPAANSVYGNGCGPAGEVTCSFDSRPAFAVPVTAWVRAWDPASLVALVFGAAQQSVPFGSGCTVHIDGWIVDLLALPQPSGWAGFDFAIPRVPGTVGLDVYAQALTLSAAGFGFSNGVALRLGD
ncbi:MAG: hypothetical protein JNL08_18060 [Planctomycetes bacterium]|nr:hypothetical protein [Planctomycetota bacterium]